MGAEKRPGRVALRVLRFASVGLCVLVGLVFLAVGSALIYVESAPGRRLVAAQVNRALLPSFQGRIEIESTKDLGLFGVSGANATIFDPSGRPVIIVRGARARIAPWALARSALFGKNAPLTIALLDVSIEDLDVRLDSDPQGQLDLAKTFDPKTPTPSTPSNSQSREVHVDIARIVLKHAWAHGRVAGAPPLDAIVDNLSGSFSYTPELLRGDIAQASIVARHIANGADVAGVLTAHVEAPEGPLSGLRGHAVWHGTVGSLAHSLDASLEKSEVSAILDAPSFDPDGVRSVWPGSTVKSSGALRIEARGTLPSVDMEIRASLGRATFNMKGNIVLSADKKAALSLIARDVDIEEFANGAPSSRVGLTGDISGSQSAAGALELAATLRFLGGTLGTRDLPRADVHATAAGASVTELRAHVDMSIEEPAAPTHVALDLVPKGRSFVLAAALESDASDLQRVPELKHAVDGSLQVAAKGTLDLSSLLVEADLKATTTKLERGATSLDSASAQVHSWGPVSRLSVDAALHGQGLVVAGRHVTSFDVAARGGLRTPHVSLFVVGTDIPTTDAKVDLDLGQAVSLRALRVVLARSGEKATVSADSIQVGQGSLRVERARIEGLGAPATINFEQIGDTLHVRAKSEGLDLGRMGRLANVEGALSAGTLSLDTDSHLAPGRASGKATVDLTDASFGDVRGVSAHVELAVDGREIKGRIKAQAGEIGSIDIDAPKLDLGEGNLLSLASLRQAWGSVSLDAQGDLAKVLDLIPTDLRPFGEAHGQLHLVGQMARASRVDRTPDLKLSFKTEGLALAPNTPRSRDIDGVMVVGPAAWHLQGVDFDGDAAINGSTGLIELETKIRDRSGELAEVDATLPHFPYADFFYNTERLADDARTSPFDIRLAVPERGLGSLPEILKQDAVTGRISGEVKASGTLLVPRVDLTATLRDPHFSGETQSLPMDIALAVHYDGKQGTASIQARAGDRLPIDAKATFDAELAQFLDPGESPAWSASGHATFAKFPLSAIPALDAKLISGNLSGDIALVDLHKNAHATADITVEGLRVGSVDYKSARIQAKTDGHSLEGTAHVDQVDGFLDTKAHAVATWGSAIVPAMDPKQPVEIDLTAKNFRIAAFLPLLTRSLDELDGRLDAGVRASLEPTTGGAVLSGTMSLSRGLIEASAGGGELHDVSASVRLNPDGTVVVDRMSASGLTGRVQGSASARFDGTRFEAAKAIFVIPSRSAIPLTANGVEIGNVDGRVEVTAAASADGRAMTLAVQVPRLHVALPEGTSSDVQALGDMGNVHIGSHKGSRTSLLLMPLDPKKPAITGSESSRTAVAVSVADIEVERGTDLRVDLNGTLHVESGAKTSVTGQIHLEKGGVLNVEGKNFEVESGTVTFSGGDSANPEVVVKAAWVAPDATVVSANFVGPLKTGKVTLSSEPTLPKQEIVELLLYGTTSGQQAQTPSSDINNSTQATENTAIATAGGQAAQPLNHALNQLGLGAVTAKVDTASVNPRPEVEVQIARGISIQLAYVLGVPPPGVNPDTTLVSLDWRFLSKWSLESTVGNLGTTIFDLLWQSRY
jgi:translocation and assembly module TamB